jgi:putative two-component system response regulator
MEVEQKTKSILIVDDVEENLRVLGRLFTGQGYRARPVPNGKLALQAAESDPPDVILMDVMMPDMNGYEVCRKIKENDRLREIPIIFISALDDVADKVNAFKAGGVDYVTKPFMFDEVKARVETHVRLRQLQRDLEEHNHHLKELVRDQVREISESQMATIFALAKLTEFRDDNTGRHTDRVPTWCKLLASRLMKHPRLGAKVDTSFIENLFFASSLHDIGKVGVRDRVLLKPGVLTAEEFEEIKSHTVIGAQTLKAVQSKYPRNAFLGMAIDIARSHHEKWDGSGYPDGLSKEEIPLSARIVAVADVYDALSSKRCYRPAFSEEKCCEMILGGSGSQFDPDIVEAFKELAEKFKSVRGEMED